MRRHNLGTLLHHVHRRGQLSRAELTSLMSLNRSTIAGLVGELDALGVIEETDPSPHRHGAGRPSPGVRVTPEGPYVVAIDVGVGCSSAARVGLGGQVLDRVSSSLPDQPDPVQVAREIARTVEALASRAPRAATLVAVGIAVPGVIRSVDGLVRVAPNLGWVDVPLCNLVIAELSSGTPVWLGNDANLGAVAEHLRGAAVGIDDLVFLCGLVGVGAGVILGGVPVDGAVGYAGEIGHMPYLPEGKPCHCGSLGCWETEIGAAAIAAATGVREDQVTRLDEVLAGFDEPSPALREIGTHLGLGLASAVNLLNPRMIVLGGYLRALYEMVGEDVDRALHARALGAASESVTLALPALGQDSVLLGAAEMAFAPMFDDPVAVLSGTPVLQS